jgi:addiction module HigA family antidote
LSTSGPILVPRPAATITAAIIRNDDDAPNRSFHEEFFWISEQLWLTSDMPHRRISPSHPGGILLHDFLEPLGLTQSALAKSIGVTPIRVSQIVRGQRAISADTALRLARFLGTRPGWWLDLQTHYDLEVAADQLEARLVRTITPCSLLTA